MTRLLILVEGQTEEIFVKQTLTPHLAQFGVCVQRPIVLWTKRVVSGGGYRGGVSNWNQIHTNLRPLIADSDAWITTILDFYGLPGDFPGLREALSPGDARQKVQALQNRFAEAINHRRLIPFLALHEFEAWLFSAPDTVQAHFELPQLANCLRAAVVEAGAPELMNHGLATHPKARLKGLIETYKETSDGPTLFAKIGLAAVRAECPHFDAWLCQLESLAP